MDLGLHFKSGVLTATAGLIRNEMTVWERYRGTRKDQERREGERRRKEKGDQRGGERNGEEGRRREKREQR